MFRFAAWVIVIGSALLVTSTRTHAQWGGCGWGGWGASTVEGDIAQGMGIFAMGLGQYNVNTAQARSIDMDTWMRYEDFWYQSLVQNSIDSAVRRGKIRQTRNEARDKVAQRLRDNPGPGDILSGDALNVANSQIANPRVYAAVMKEAQVPIPSALFRDIPFHKASEAITMTLNRLIQPANWPSVFSDPKVKPELDAVKAIFEAEQEENDHGDVSFETIQKMQENVTALRKKVQSITPERSKERREAEKYIKALLGLSKMLYMPDMRDLLLNVDKSPNRTLADLINFMQTFDLRFGVANTPRERAAYQQLYPLLDQLRKKVVQVAEGAGSPGAQALSASNITDFFGAMPEAELNETPVVPVAPAPKPPAASNP